MIVGTSIFELVFDLILAFESDESAAPTQTRLLRIIRIIRVLRVMRVIKVVKLLGFAVEVDLAKHLRDSACSACRERALTEAYQPRFISALTSLVSSILSTLKSLLWSLVLLLMVMYVPQGSKHCISFIYPLWHLVTGGDDCCLCCCRVLLLTRCVCH